MLKHKSFFLLVLACIFLFKLILFNYTYKTNPSSIWRNDSFEYAESAKAISQLNSFTVSVQNQTPQVFRTPGYPFFLAIHYKIFGENGFSFAIYTQILIHLLIVIFLALIIKELKFDNNIAVILIISAVFFILDQETWRSMYQLLSEPLFTLFLMISAFFSIQHLKKKPVNTIYALLLGLSLALSVLIRPIAYYLIFIVLLILVSFWIKNKEPFLQCIKRFALILIPYIILIGGWTLRNYSIANTPTFCSIKNANLFLYRGSGIIAQRDNISFNEASNKIRKEFVFAETLSIKERSDLYGREGWKLVIQHPKYVIKDQIKGMLKIMTGLGAHSFAHHFGIKEGKGFKIIKLFGKIHYVILFLGVILGFLYFIRNKRFFSAENIFLLSIILYFIILSSGPDANARFRVPVTPIFCVYAGIGWWWVLSGRLRCPPKGTWNLLGDRSISYVPVFFYCPVFFNVLKYNFF